MMTIIIIRVELFPNYESIGNPVAPHSNHIVLRSSVFGTNGRALKPGKLYFGFVQ